MKIGSAALGGVITILFFAALSVGGLDAITSDALKVQHILRTIETSKDKTGQTEPRSTIITQKELNAYFDYRLAQDKNPLIKKVDVVLEEQNQVSGTVDFDLESVQILKLFGKNLHFDFKGRLKTREGAGKLELTALQLNGEAVPPKSLNPILFAVARFYGHEPGDIDDWYELPHGIEYIELHPAKAILYY